MDFSFLFARNGVCPTELQQNASRTNHFPAQLGVEIHVSKKPPPLVEKTRRNCLIMIHFWHPPPSLFSYCCSFSLRAGSTRLIFAATRYKCWLLSEPSRVVWKLCDCWLKRHQHQHALWDCGVFFLPAKRQLFDARDLCYRNCFRKTKCLKRENITTPTITWLIAPPKQTSFTRWPAVLHDVIFIQGLTFTIKCIEKNAEWRFSLKMS